MWEKKRLSTLQKRKLDQESVSVHFNLIYENPLQRICIESEKCQT